MLLQYWCGCSHRRGSSDGPQRLALVAKPGRTQARIEDEIERVRRLAAEAQLELDAASAALQDCTGRLRALLGDVQEF